MLSSFEVQGEIDLLTKLSLAYDKLLISGKFKLTLPQIDDIGSQFAATATARMVLRWAMGEGELPRCLTAVSFEKFRQSLKEKDVKRG